MCFSRFVWRAMFDLPRWCDYLQCHFLRSIWNGWVERFQSAGLNLKLKKYQFAQKSVAHVAHIISNKGIKPDKVKLEAVANYPTPANTKEVKQILGHSNYYRWFISGYTSIAEPLLQLLRKSSKGFSLLFLLQCSQVKAHFSTSPSLPKVYQHIYSCYWRF